MLNRRAFLCGTICTALGTPRAARAQPPIRVGASLSQTGAYAALGQNQLRGYQLCVKHMNDRGGLLGRSLRLLVYDDHSEPATAIRLYQKLITQDKVDVVLGPYGSPITEAVADVAEKHRLPMPAHAATTSIFKKGRKFVFMVLSPAEVFLAGLVDLAARSGLKTVALINEDTIATRAIVRGTVELAKKKASMWSSRRRIRRGISTSRRSSRRSRLRTRTF
jgi:branched-chain amino acid transport system substrate-binding protein